MEDLFEKEFIESLGYEVISDDGVYGKAESTRAKGMTILSWNREGTTINYFGDKIEYGAFFGIQKDGGTRTAYNGLVRTREQVEMFVELAT